MISRRGFVSGLASLPFVDILQARSEEIKRIANSGRVINQLF